MKQCKLLSLDTSSSCSGWSIFLNGEYSKSGVFNLKKIKSSDERFKEMCTILLYTLNTEQPDIVGIEMTVVTRNAAVQRLLTMILGVVYGWCVIHNVEFIMLRPTEWRALISSEKKGRKRDELKKWSMDKVKTLFGKDVSDDEADAILIGQAIINKRCK